MPDNNSLFFDMGSNDDGIVINAPDSAGSEDLTLDVISSLGLTNTDDLILDVDDTDIDALIDEGDEIEEISDAVLLHTSDSVVDVLIPYAQRVTEAITLLETKNVPVTQTKFVVPHSEFPYIPDDVFVTFHSILLDIAKQKSNLEKPLEDLAEESITKLYEATLWSPHLNRPEYIEKFKSWCDAFRVLANVKTEVNKSDITTLMSEEELVLSRKVFEINTVPFVQLNMFFQDAAAMGSSQKISVDALGEFTKSYMERNNLKAFTVRDGYNAISECLSSEDTGNALRLSQDEILDFSTGELLRRFILFELNNGFLYPTGMRGKNPDDPAVIITMLDNAIKSGSVAAEIIYIIGVMLLNTSKGEEGVTTFLTDMAKFFLAFLDDPAVVNPVFYGHVSHEQDCYELSYAAGDKSYEVSSDDILCDVIGDKTGTYCIPKVLLDAKNGFAVCPPPQIVSPLRQIVIGGKNHVNGSMCYKFSPTVNWLLANHVLAEECVEEKHVPDNAMQAEGSGLLQVLLDYDNRFTDDGSIVTPVVVNVENYNINAVSNGVAGTSISICSVERGGSIVANTGSMLYDEDTGNIIVSFIDLNQELHEFVAERGSYEEQYLGTANDSDNKSVDLEDFIEPAVISKPVEFRDYRKAVTQLCELAALDYDEELQSVQEVIARDLFYAVCIPDIDALVATRILKAYKAYASERKGAGEKELIDTFNFPSFQELFDIVIGKPNIATPYKKWVESLNSVVSDIESHAALRVDAVCAKLDKLDMDELALQITSRGELKRDIHLDAYRAIHYIPEIGTRLCVLEDKMITLRVLSILGGQAVSLFSKRSFMARFYSSQLVKENLDIANSTLLEKSKKNVECVLPLSKKVLNVEPNPDSVIFKYFVLERNLYGLLTAMKTAGDRYAVELNGYLTEIGYDSEKDIDKISVTEFKRQVSDDMVVRFFGSHRDRMQQIVEDGLLNEILANNKMQLIKAYDLFNAFYDIVIGGSLWEKDQVVRGESDEYESDFLCYAGSLIISYAPITDTSAGDVDGGENRFAAFVKSPQDFYYDVPIEFLRALDLQDVRVIIEA